MSMKFWVVPDTGDGNTLATVPEPISLEDVGAHIVTWLARFETQGHYLNCKQERVPLDEVGFRLEPASDE